MEIQYRPAKLHGSPNPAQNPILDWFLFKRNLKLLKAHTEIQNQSHIVDTDVIADAVCADAVSETSKNLLLSNLKIGS